MKKTVLLLSTAMVLFACGKIETDTTSPEGGSTGPEIVSFRVKVAETKSGAKSGWEPADKIYVVFEGIGTKYLVLTYNNQENWDVDPSEDFMSDDFSGLTVNELTAVHFPVPVTPSLSDGVLSFASDPKHTYYLRQNDVEYQVDGAEVTLTLALSKAAGFVQFHVPGIAAAEIADYSFAVNDVIPVACSSITASTGVISEVSGNVGGVLYGFADADGAVFSGRLVKPDVEDSYTFLLTGTSHTYRFTKTRTLSAGTFYKFKATDDPLWTSVLSTQPAEYVDLGLPSGLKWATRNVGYDGNNSDRGKYYSWGETFGYGPYVPNTYQSNSTEPDHYFSDGTYGNSPVSQKYNTEDGKKVLEAVDDAATVNMGTGWRMPTREEVQELLDHCSWVYQDTTEPFGYTVTSTNGNSIFLPLLGTAYQAQIRKQNNRLEGFWYWTATFDLNPARSELQAYGLRVYDENSYPEVRPFTRRSPGNAIRAVYDR